jgi:hypothetical protein
MTKETIDPDTLSLADQKIYYSTLKKAIQSKYDD